MATSGPDGEADGIKGAVTGRGWDPYSGPVPGPRQAVSVMDRRKQYHSNNLLSSLREDTNTITIACLYMYVRFSNIGRQVFSRRNVDMSYLNVADDLSRQWSALNR